MVTTAAFESQVKLALRGENVMIESGGITWLYNYEFYPFPSAVRSIRLAADWVGIDRLMWGSDYPRTITAITYRMSYDFILKTREMSWEEKKAFLGENAAGLGIKGPFDAVLKLTDISGPVILNKSGHKAVRYGLFQFGMVVVQPL